MINAETTPSELIQPQPEMPITHAGGIVLRLDKKDNNHQILLVKQIENNGWSFPKGHIEYGETPEQAADREVYEETNLELVNLGLIGCFKRLSRHTGEQKHLAMFAYLYAKPLPRPRISKEISTVERFYIPDARLLLPGEDGEFLMSPKNMELYNTLGQQALSST